MHESDSRETKLNETKGSAWNKGKNRKQWEGDLLRKTLPAVSWKFKDRD